jgi:NAD(P)-dependent dehydrogenase (short-subunit alcohol dehydrogenase family)
MSGGSRKESEMLLEDKVAVVYGAGGAIGGAVGRAFAREGARVFLTGRSLNTVELVAKDIHSEGWSAETAEVDALDEQAVDRHLQHVMATAGSVAISFNGVGIPDPEILGTPMIDLDLEWFSLPIAAYTRSYFITARMAARRMVTRGSGVIMTVTAIPSRAGFALQGGYGPAQAAKEALTRALSAELAPRGIRVVGLRPNGLPETDTLREAFEARAPALGTGWDEWQQVLANRTHPRRLSTLAELADMAAFMASEKARGMTGTTVNLTMGTLDD